MDNKKGSTPIEQEAPAQIGESVTPETPRGFSNKRNILIIAIALVVLIIGGAVTAVAVTRGGTQSAESIMTLAERYLKEEKYEQAVIEFQRVIELDPMNVDAYLNLAEAYLGLGDKEKALEVLREGLEKTGDSRLQAKIDELTKPAESSSEAQSSSMPESSSVVSSSSGASSSSTTSSSSSSSSSSEPVESEPEAVTSVTIQGVEYDVATTTFLNLCEKGINDKDLKQIGKLTNLNKLYLTRNQISDITPLAGLTNLTDLDFEGNQISDITPLVELTNLKSLSLWNNKISDISPLGGLTNLVFLDLRFNQISDITPLAGLTNLTYLTLSGNQISDITTLAGLTNLTSLWLSKNQISDITILASLTNLGDLDLWNNQISNITPLAGLTNLETLSLGDNPISDADKAWIKEQLPNCDVHD